MITIALPPEVEAKLAEEARRRGTTPELLAADCLVDRLGSQPTGKPSGDGTTLFDFLAGYVGAVSGSSEPFSEQCGHRFGLGLAESERRSRS
jgi:hypothetical protein